MPTLPHTVSYLDEEGPVTEYFGSMAVAEARYAALEKAGARGLTIRLKVMVDAVCPRCMARHMGYASTQKCPRCTEPLY